MCATKSRVLSGSRSALRYAEEGRAQRVGKHLLGFLVSQTGDEHVLWLVRLVVGCECGITGVGQQPGTVRDFLKDRVEIEVFADPQDRLGQPGKTGTKSLISQARSRSPSPEPPASLTETCGLPPGPLEAPP